MWPDWLVTAVLVVCLRVAIPVCADTVSIENGSDSGTLVNNIVSYSSFTELLNTVSDVRGDVVGACLVGNDTYTFTCNMVTVTRHPPSDQVAPRPPGGLRLTFDDSDVVLSWSASTTNEDDTECTDLAYYAIHRSDNLYTLTTTWAEISTTTALSWRDAGAHSLPTRYYCLTALDQNSNRSSPSLIVSSHADRPIIVLAREEGQLRAEIMVPASIASPLYKSSNSYGDDVSFVLERVSSKEDADTIRAYRIKPIKATTEEEISKFTFTEPRVELSLSYEVDADNKIEKIGLDAGGAPKVLGLGRFNGIEWLRCGGTVDMDAKKVTVKTSRVGLWRLAFSPRPQELTVTNVVPRIFTPYKDNRNDIVQFIYDGAEPEEIIEARIYNIEGLRIAELKTGEVEKSCCWDGRDANDNIVPAGIYIYQLRTTSEVYNGTVVVAR